jgi:hypothetical protein
MLIAPFPPEKGRKAAYKMLVKLTPPGLILTWRDVHGLGVDEGEEEDIGALLLVLVKSWLPIGIGLETFVIVISEKDVDSHHLETRREKK